VSRGRILVADDKESYLALFKRIVPSDLELVCVSDGTDAIAKLTSEPFDVIVSDIRMPGADGFTVLEKVREGGIDVEVVLMTAYGTIPDAVRAMKTGAADYLTKPFGPDVAIAAIERALARRAARRTAGLAPEPTSVEKPLTAMTYREVLAAGRDKATSEYIVALLREFQGNVTQASERAGIERESFHRLMKRHGIRAEDYRPR
jgi:DNA-binding NtrC family response regulator